MNNYDSSYETFHDFHLIDLPKRLVGDWGLRAAKLSRELEPLCLRLLDSDNAYTYRPMPYSVEVVAGTEADVEIQIDKEQWQKMLENNGELISEIRSDDSRDTYQSDFLERWQRVLTEMFSDSQ